MLEDAPVDATPLSRAESVARVRDAFASLHPALSGFFGELLERGFTDLESRPGKSPGAFCATLPDLGLPFLFANLSGSGADLQTLVHESGHAFQRFWSNGLPLIEYLLPTVDIGEVHSTSLELLCLAQADRLYGREFGPAQRERVIDGAILGMAQVAAVESFQRLVYTHPEASPAERNAFWLDSARRFIPWRRHGDVEHARRGAIWQGTRHIYLTPFYAIDYAIASCITLQLWDKSLRSCEDALQAYERLAAGGGALSVHDVVRVAGVRSPFDASAVRDVTAVVRDRFGGPR